MKQRKPYCLIKRPNTAVYYMQFTDSTGKIRRISTGETTQTRAHQVAFKLLSEGDIVQIKGNCPTLAQFANGFFDFNGEWATSKKVIGKKIGLQHCNNLQRRLELHILPTLGAMRLDAIDKQVIIALRNDMYNHDFAGDTINQCLTIIKMLLEDAEDKGLIKQCPRVTRVSSKSKHDRGILTPQEVKALFAARWENQTARTACLLAVTTGLRAGEIQGLVVSDLHLAEGYLVCRRSWNKGLNILNDTTKNGRERNIILTPNVIAELQLLVDNNPHANLTKDDFVFWSKDRDRPITQLYIRKFFFAALDSIGIDSGERIRRNIVFHSFRHYLNSLLINAKIPLQKVQSITGHLTDEMSQHYYHQDDMSDVLEVTKSIV